MWNYFDLSHVSISSHYQYGKLTIQKQKRVRELQATKQFSWEEYLYNAPIPKY